MKDHEIYKDLKVPKGSKIILRLDGRNFHNLSKKLSFKKHHDSYFSKSMVEASVAIFKEFSPFFIYTFSDEINILLNEIPFSGRIEKLNSVFPSLVSSVLTLRFNSYFKENIIKNNHNSQEFDEIGEIISFDSRIIPTYGEDVLNYFKWRQDEAWRNCINSYAFWTLKDKFSTKIAVKKLNKLKSSGIHELLFKEGINLNDLPVYQKRGIAIYKKKIEIEGFNPKSKKKELSHRNRLVIDKELPVFDKNFFKKIDYSNKLFFDNSI